MKNIKYGIVSLRKQFPNDDACLEFIFDTLYPRKCSRRVGRDLWTTCGGIYKRIYGRRQFQCSKCRLQVAPASGTIFHKSDTPLVLWFHAILAFLNAKGAISAKQLERDLEISYKCAWRILALTRKILDDFPRLYTSGLGYADVVALVIKTEPKAKQRRKRKKYYRTHLV